MPEPESPKWYELAGDRFLHGATDLRRLKIAGVVLPLTFILVLEAIRLVFIEKSFASYGLHTFLAGATIVGVIAFSFVMFQLIGRAQDETGELVRDLRRRQREGHAFYDVLLRISNQEPLAEILAAVARHARDLLGGDAGAVCLNEATTRLVALDSTPAGVTPLEEGICVTPDLDSHGLHDLRQIRSLRSSPEFKESLRVRVQSPDRVLGELWIGRRSAPPFTERDRQFLTTFSDFISIAVTSAGMRESEQQSAILAERERIARELHDSLAQVLGAVHLRLRALSAGDDAVGGIGVQLSELADICDEGYRDARGAILDLHHSSRTDPDLLNSLRAYLKKYSQQCGIETSLETSIDHGLALAPNSEIQIIRVIQEALTNVRKHSGAASAAVRIARADGCINFVIEDNGRGFDANEAVLDRDGFGLHAMRQRMELIGGTLATESAAGRGTRVVAKVPDIPARAPIASI